MEGVNSDSLTVSWLQFAVLASNALLINLTSAIMRPTSNDIVH